jgi:hypothetical protein
MHGKHIYFNGFLFFFRKLGLLEELKLEDALAAKSGRYLDPLGS